MGVINKGAFPYQIAKDIDKMYYKHLVDMPTEYDKIFKVQDAPKGADITEAELSGLGAMREMSEGEGVEFDTPAEGHKKSRYYKAYGLAYQITQEMIEDELFGKINKLTESLAKSGRDTIEYYAWAVLNNAFTTSGTGSTCWDALAVCANNHSTLKSATTINNYSTSSLSTTSLQAAFDYFDLLVDEAGMPLLMKPKHLIIPSQLKWVANDLLKATGRVWDFAAADINRGAIEAGTTKGYPAADMTNTLNPRNGIVDDWSVFATHYLTDTNSWFVLGDNYDLRLYFKRRMNVEQFDDFKTGNRIVKSTGRFTAFCNDYKGIYGSTGGS
jgi:phage major head subunit gpT-like protein